MLLYKVSLLCVTITFLEAGSMGFKVHFGSTASKALVNALGSVKFLLLLWFDQCNFLLAYLFCFVLFFKFQSQYGTLAVLELTM